MNFSASSKLEIPPAALIFTEGPTCSFIKATASNVAPPVENPVDVLIYSAPARVTTLHNSISSSVVNKQISTITFKILP